MPSLLLFVLFASSLFPATVISVPQDSPGTAEPALVPAASSLGGPTATASCGGCFVVADVVAIVWYSQVFAYTAATAYYNIATGNSTGRSTSISIVTNTEEFSIHTDQFTIRPGATGADAKLAVTPVTYGPNATFNGAVLSSPTAYNVFTAFAVNIESTSGDQCVTETGETTILATAYSEEIADNPGTVTLGAAGEQDFVTKFLTLPNCRPQSANVVPPTALLPVLSLTSTVTLQYPTVTRQTRISIAPTSTLYKTNQSGSTTLTSAVGTTTLTSVVGTFTAIPEVASSSEGGSVSGSESTSGPKTTTSRIASAPLVIVGNSTITPDRNPVTLPFYTATSVGSVSNGVVIVVPTGTGSQAGNYTAIVPYISNSGSFRRGYFWTSLWAATLSGIGLVMVWL